MRVLIIEEDPVTRLLLAQILVSLGHSCEECESVDKAKDALARDPASLIVLETALSGMNGIEFCQWLRHQPEGDRPYLLVGTADTTPDTCKRILDAGANDYIRKPYRPDYLRNRLIIAEKQAQSLAHQKTLELELKDEKDFISFVLDTAGALILVLNPDYTIARFNHTCTTVTGLPKEHFLNKPFYEAVVEEEERQKTVEHLELLMTDPTLVSFETHIVTNHDPKTYVSWRCTSLLDEQGALRFIICTGTDITELHTAKERMAFLAERDTLTGLYNRSKLNFFVKEAVNKARSGVSSAVIYIDLDNFKLVNDTMGGHSSGDKVLTEASALIKKATRGVDSIFRFGGDEFVVVLNNVASHQAQVIAERIRNALADFVFRYEGRSLNIACSIGVTQVDGESAPEEVIAQADAACYMAKSHGRNRIEAYTKGSDAVVELREEGDWITRVKEGIKENLFELWFQPIDEIKTGETAFFEALIRLRTAKGDIIPPNVFLPAAERFKLSADIDRYVIEKAFNYVKTHSDMTLSVNLSGQSFGDPRFPEFVEDLRWALRLDTSRIIFEITESIMMANIDLGYAVIDHLRAQGFRFALDDFGTGFSSLSQLKNLPVDFLKIDGSFIEHMTSEPANQLFVKTINEFAHHLNIKSVAEFVEDEETMDILRDLGVDYAQGFFLGKPAPEAVANKQGLIR